MEHFFYHHSPSPIFFFEPEQNSPIYISAFENYYAKSVIDDGEKSCLTSENINKRIIGFYRKSWDQEIEKKDVEKERCYKHMMSERFRREKQKHSFLALLALLPHGTKNDKKTIVRAAINELKRLENHKEELQRREMELEALLAAKEEFRTKTEASKIKFRVSNPDSGIDSMLELLKYMKNVGCKTRTIDMKEQVLSVTLEIGHELRIC